MRILWERKKILKVCTRMLFAEVWKKLLAQVPTHLNLLSCKECMEACASIFFSNLWFWPLIVLQQLELQVCIISFLVTKERLSTYKTLFYSQSKNPHYTSKYIFTRGLQIFYCHSTIEKTLKSLRIRLFQTYFFDHGYCLSCSTTKTLYFLSLNTKLNSL